MDSAIFEKFWFFSDIEDLLLKSGFSQLFSDIATLILSLIILYFTIALIDYILNLLILRFVHNFTSKTATKWDDFLAERGFFHFVSRFSISILSIYVVDLFLTGHNEALVEALLIVVKIISIYFMVRIIFSIMNVLSDIYNTQPRSKEKSITGYIQTVKIIVVLLAIINSFVVIFDVSITTFITSIAAFAAVFALVFKDLVLGFFASIQISTQDMVRLADWIEMPSKGANGIVIEITVTTVKVQNWDKTITMIPIYSMVSEYFINWRGMRESGGRRFKRPFFINLNSVKSLNSEQIESFKKSKIAGKYIKMALERREDVDLSEISNLSLFRFAVDAMLKSNEKINSKMTLHVRYREMTDRGMPLQIYAFTKKKDWEAHEIDANEVVESVVLIASELDIKFYQIFSDNNDLNLVDP